MAVILFDIDKTLFDTSAFFDNHFRQLLAEKYDLSLEESYRLMGDYLSTLPKNTDFNPEDLFEFISNQFPKISSTKVKEVFYQPAAFRQAVFPDVIETLASLQKKHILGIFSEAEVNSQRKKLELSDLKPFFDPDFIFIFKRKETTQALAKLPSGAWIIDDKPSVIQTVLGYKKYQPIWLNRQKKQMPITEVVPTIHSLTEIIDIVS